jgi:hypothetical protein
LGVEKPEAISGFEMLKPDEDPFFEVEIPDAVFRFGQ